MSAGTKFGALDVGTNTVLMLVAEADTQGRVRPLADLSRITRLGRGVDRNGRLDPDAAARTLDAIVEFADRARALGAGKILTAATSALRDAADGGEFIARVRARAGVDLEVVSGETEARLSYLAVVNGLRLDPQKRLLIVDIGGGSTELIFARPGGELAMTSIQIGSVRLTERIVRNDPPAAADVAELRRTIDAALDATRWRLKPDCLVGIAGTVTTVCAVALELRTYDPGRVHGAILSRAQVEQVLARFGTLPLEQRKQLPGMVEGRADVIFAGTMILARIMEKFAVGSVIVSDQGVRWGLVWRELARFDESASQDQRGTER
jgi:exopolyphosphatase / guanosine-5'-triphosphate,3'-diphosphate pyrophosphatase